MRITLIPPMDAAPPNKFVWPPAPPPREAAVAARGTREAPPTAASAPPTPAARLRLAWTEVERAWLDPVALPLAQRAVVADWAPDEPAAYCDHCGRDIGAHESSESGCSRCANSRLPWQRCVRLGRYEADLADWICEVKFTRWRILGFEIGRLLGRQVRSAGFLSAGHARPLIVPVPTSFRRRMSRGIDHAAVIARGVAWELGVPLRRCLRRDHRPSQRAVAFSDRVSNVNGTIHLRRGAGVAGRTVLLIDDVMTTGATMRTAARALQSCPPEDRPASVWVGVVAVTPEGNHA